MERRIRQPISIYSVIWQCKHVSSFGEVVKTIVFAVRKMGLIALGLGRWILLKVNLQIRDRPDRRKSYVAD